MTRADSVDAPDYVTVYVTKEGDATNLCGDTHPRGVRYVKAPKADGGAEGAALSEEADEIERLRGFSKGGLLSMTQVDWLFATIDRLRAREHEALEAVGDCDCHVCDKVRAALEKR